MANIIISEKYLRSLLYEPLRYAERHLVSEDEQSLRTRIERLEQLQSIGLRALAANKHGRVAKGQLEE